MKLKDFVYDVDLKKATIFLEEIGPEQLENLMLILDDGKEKEGCAGEKVDYSRIIFEDSN